MLSRSSSSSSRSVADVDQDAHRGAGTLRIVAVGADEPAALLVDADLTEIGHLARQRIDRNRARLGIEPVERVAVRVRDPDGLTLLVPGDRVRSRGAIRKIVRLRNLPGRHVDLRDLPG